MPFPKPFILLLGLLIGGYALGEEPAAAPPPKDYGYYNTLIQAGKTAVLIQLLPDDKDQAKFTVNAKVLVDVHGKIKPGTTIKISGGDVSFAGAAQVDLPAGYDPRDKDVIYVWPIQEQGPGKYRYFDDQGVFPIGVSAQTRIASSDADKVKAAFKELRAAIEAPGHAGPSRARAGELLKDKNFYLWALGVWRIAHDTNRADIALLKRLLTDDPLTPAQAVWVLEVLTNDLKGEAPPGEMPLPQLSAADIAGLLTTYLHGLADRQPGAGGGVAPTTAPARPPLDQ